MQKLYQLANVMGLDVSNPQHTALLKEAMHNIILPDDFIEYCRKYKEGITYSNRVEKLDLLATRYKSTINDIPVDSIEGATRITVKKFKDAISKLRDNEIILEGHLERLVVNHDQWFTNQEINRLNAIGRLRNCIYAYEVGSLYEKLYEVSVKRYLFNKNESLLTVGQKRIKGLINAI